MNNIDNKISLEQFDKYLKKMFSKFRDVEIPNDLNIVVEKAINEGKEAVDKKKSKLFLVKFSKCALVCSLLIVAMLNISPAFARTMKEIPVAGEIFSFFTFREYHYEDEIKYVNVKAPIFTNTGKSQLEKKVNKEIKYFIDKEIKESEQIIKEYYDAFIATGGKREEFHPVELNVDYNIYIMSDKIVSFSITKYDNTFNAYNTKNFYNIDMKTGQYLTLEDYIGNDYKKTVINAINKEIGTWSDEEKGLLWDDLNFNNLISGDTNFYINNNGNVVIVFEKYEIAAGSAGEIEFVIPIDDSSEVSRR